MAVDRPPGASYDEVPYAGTAHLETHPDRLAVVATLMGLSPPPVASCRVLELGCAEGENLLAIAQSLPDARLVGIDLSARQVEMGRSAARAAGMGNVEFHARSIEDAEDDLGGPFDYVLCHGVYSWVPAGTRDAILALCARRLTPDGVAFVSYNTFPGWSFPSMLRGLMMFHVSDLSDPEEKYRQALAVLDLYERSIPESQSLHGRVFRDEVSRISPRTPSYLLHEHLEEVNEPCFFHEFVAKAEGHGLRVVGDARISTMAAVQPASTRAFIGRLTDDPLRREQYLDFLSNRRFRRTVLCRSDRQPRPAPVAEATAMLRVSALAVPESATVPGTAGGAETFKLLHDGTRVSLSDPATRAALAILAESLPRSLPFETLRTLVAARVGRPAPEMAELVLKAHVDRLVELHTFEPGLAAEPPERPAASPVARRQAEAGRAVVNLRHRLARLSDFDTLVLRQLDGRRDRPAILSALAEAVARGEFAIRDQLGNPLSDGALVASVLGRSLEPSLRRLALASLLVG